ncbi:protein BIG GRAIN 1-like A [Diospyros lotus]|uniref:protein BIG GRAIN 1-like A n=1 Tax=Diospyros lotus TaxID=55363 RepID=UPI00225929DD|nr:protein BIG GRAIN 1-like A [Diospyros lotus]
MEAWERSLREERYMHPQRRKTPSFSSSLLDAIYRSIDDEPVLCPEATASATRTKKQRNANLKRNSALEDEESVRRAIMIEKWMESESRSHISRSSRLCNSTSSSSESSCGGVFSSSETESGYNRNAKQRPKQVRTSGSVRSNLEKTTNHEGRLTRTKSKALKMYGDLKKVKQPISPGRRFTNFLNSIFSSRNVKTHLKHETARDSSSIGRSRSVKDTTTFSMSCLRKMPPSRAKLSTNNVSSSKRSVRFYPFTVIVDEDSRPCGHKSIYGDDPSLMPTPRVRKIAETAILKSTNTRQLREFQLEDEDEEDDDGMSCTSSDLFELENIGAVGVGAYREELPVYGTTCLKTHHAIANGLIL